MQFYKSPQISVFIGEVTHNWQGNTGLGGSGLFTVMILSTWSLQTKFHMAWCEAMKRW